MKGLALFALAVSEFWVDVQGWEHISGKELQSKLAGSEAVVVAFKDDAERVNMLESEWTLAAGEGQGALVSLDCVADPETCESQALSRPATIKLFNQGQAISTYQGPRRASAILAWSQRVQRPVVTEVLPESLETFKKADETVILGFFQPEDENAKIAFNNVASKYREEFTFGIASDAAALESEKVEAPAPVVKCFKPLDGTTVDLNGFQGEEALEKFVKEASRPLIGELLPHNHQRFLDRQWPMVYVFARTEPERAEIRESLNKLASDYYESLTMVTVDPLDFPELPAKLGLVDHHHDGADGGGGGGEVEYPAGAVHQLSKDRIYPYPRGRGFTSRELQSWGLNVYQGRVKPWTPPGVTTSYDDIGAGGRIQATQKVSMRNLNIPGVNIRVGGRDEL
ncbi:thioredoxin-like domain-containing protein [Xylariomycetidae sp. FL2044]|nr:thioredoxin-like domain-containing protein [Xylariomycetidae sp. FL2044]